MKKLEFTDMNRESYDMLYEVVRARPVKGIEEIMKAAAIVEKLKEVGMESGKGDMGEFKAHKLKTTPTTLELEDDHFNYIKKAFEETPMATSVKIELLAQTARLLKSADSS